MKKFYTTVLISPVPTPELSEGYQVLLDGRVVQTPAKRPLVLATFALAEAIADEWRAQGDRVVPDTMPLLQMATTLQDRVISQRPHLEAEALDYLDTDLVCYRADSPETYRQAQEAAWDKFVHWAGARLGVALQTTTGLHPLVQAQQTHDTLAAAVRGMTDPDFMALYLTTLGTGSVILGLAFVERAFSAADILDAAFAEEKRKDQIYLSEQYGSAPDQEKRYKALESQLAVLQRLRELLSL